MDRKFLSSLFQTVMSRGCLQMVTISICGTRNYNKHLVGRQYTAVNLKVKFPFSVCKIVANLLAANSVPKRTLSSWVAVND